MFANYQRNKYGLGNSHLTCDRCGVTYNSPHYLKTHQKFVCRGDPDDDEESLPLPVYSRAHTCKFCGQKFKTKEGLSKHLQSLLHKGAVPGQPQHFKWVDGVYVCNYCGEKTKKGISVQGHLRKVHGDKINLEFRCDACSAVFQGPRSLGNHRMTCEAVLKGGGEDGSGNDGGTKRTPTILIHRCQFCPMEFRSRNLALLHKRKVHPVEFTRHKCDACEVSFTTKAFLVRHKRLCGKNSAKSVGT